MSNHVLFVAVMFRGEVLWRLFKAHMEEKETLFNADSEGIYAKLAILEYDDQRRAE